MTDIAITIPGINYVPPPEDQDDSIKSALEDATNLQLIEELTERLQKAAEERVSSPAQEYLPASICLNCFLRCYQTTGRLRTCATTFVFMLGVSTIIGDFITYAGGANPEISGYVAMGIMLGLLLATSIYLGCKRYYQQALPNTN